MQDEDITYTWSPDPFPVLIGIIVVASMYLFPLFPVPGRIGSPLTLAAIAMGEFAPPFPQNFLYLLALIMGWGVAIGLLIYGLVNKKPDLSFENV
ncbi:MAG: hypothetical protein CVV32_10520 [Methanomicrobiales archaeon HGW-Methanomicrobiales-3]|nr:MAG: hypothetical protein CVV32_10520 [Methanomicrobiales archaeon HGW-Methanomicrobiales-3]